MFHLIRDESFSSTAEVIQTGTSFPDLVDLTRVYFGPDKNKGSVFS